MQSFETEDGEIDWENPDIVKLALDGCDIRDLVRRSLHTEHSFFWVMHQFKRVGFEQEGDGWLVMR